jgi:FAD/FMN-containing dehydrogenase
MYASNGSNFRQMPIGVVISRALEDMVAAHRVCAGFGEPVVNRGGGTSLPGKPSRCCTTTTSTR